jgi:hypothetical protein
MAGENQQHDLALANGSRDFAGKSMPRPDVSWRDPAPDAGSFKRSANSFGGVSIPGRVGDKNVAGHGQSSRFYLFLCNPATELMRAAPAMRGA